MYLRSFLCSVLIFCVYGCTSGSEDFEPVKFTLTIISSEGGSVNTSGGTYNEGTEITIIATSNEGYEFTGWEGFDSSEESITFTITSNIILTANFSPLYIESITVTNPINELVISRKHKFQINGTFNNGEIKDISDLVELELNDDRITLLGNNEFTAGKSGPTSIKVKYNDLEDTQQFNVLFFEDIINELEGEYLSQNNTGLEVNVPIIIINFHPTLDGLNIDERRFIDDYFIRDRFYDYYDLSREYCNNNPTNEVCKVGTLEMYKLRGKEIHMFTKYGIEEGSKFRGSKYDSSQTINVEVKGYFNFYELPTKMYDGFNVPQPNYEEVFNLINLEQLVNNQGVKEVWFAMSPLSIEYPWIQQGLISSDFLINLPESNMSSPHGDISNSTRTSDDLPIYNKTYVVYGSNLDRGPSESLHCRGHQIESQLRHIEANKVYGEELFWNKFVGFDNTGKPFGRCGTTHFPPNTRVDYDYCNDDLVESDILNWLPSGGIKDLVNCETWTNVDYDFPFEPLFWNENNYLDNISRDSGYKWFVFWFQSFPNEDNNIPYEKNGNSYTLTNWWDIYYNWDDTITDNKTLWE